MPPEERLKNSKFLRALRKLGGLPLFQTVNKTAEALMQGNGEQQSAKGILSRRTFLATGSAALSAISLTKNMEGQMRQAKTEPWGRILNGRVAVVTGAA
jgi:hypothetical protein